MRAIVIAAVLAAVMLGVAYANLHFKPNIVIGIIATIVGVGSMPGVLVFLVVPGLRNAFSDHTAIVAISLISGAVWSTIVSVSRAGARRRRQTS